MLATAKRRRFNWYTAVKAEISTSTTASRTSNNELLVKWKQGTRTTRKSKIENIIRKTGDPTIRPVAGDPPSIDDNSCRGILTKIFQELGLDRVVAVDIAFGTSGYKLQLCSRADRLLALDLNPHYQSEDEEKLYKMDKYLWYFKSVCTSANIFSEEENRIEIFKKKVLSEAGIIKQDNITKRVNVVVVGPILATEARTSIASRHSTSQKGARLPNMAIHRILQLLVEVKLLDETAYLITFTPVAINGDASVALQFANFVPSWRINGLSSPVVACRRPRSNRCGSACGCCVPEDATDLPVRIPCGLSYCDFDVKVYKIPLDSLRCARKQSQQDRASSSEIGSEVENDSNLSPSPLVQSRNSHMAENSVGSHSNTHSEDLNSTLSQRVTVTHNDLQLHTTRLSSSVAGAESQCDGRSVTVTEV